MFDYQAGLVVGFLLLAIVTGWNVIKIQGNYLLKMVSIFVLLYYSIAVFYTIPEILGWPAGKDLPPNAKIISVRIIEPGDTKGAMYFWLNEKPNHEKDVWNLLRPDKIFIYSGSIQPRSYKIEYDRELHRKLLESIKKQGKNKGSFLLTGEKGISKKKKGRGRFKDDSVFKVLNPAEMLPK